MNLRKTIVSRAGVLAFLSCGLASLPSAAKVTVVDKDGGVAISGKNEVRVDPSNMRHDDVKVAKGEIVSGDVVTSGAILIEGTVNGNCVSFGGRVNVPGTVRGDVVSLGGGVDLDGSARGDLAAIGGSVRVSGKVGGDIAAVGGDVTLDKGAAVGGDVSVVGGHLSKEDDVSIKGSVSQVGFGALKALVPALTHGGLRLAMTSGADSWPRSRWRRHFEDEDSSLGRRAVSAAAFLTFVVGLGLVLCLAGLFLPKETLAIATAIRRDFWRSVGTGTLMAILFLPGLLVLTVSILGIPLVPLAILAWCAASLLGIAAFSRILAERAAESLQKSLPAVALTVGLGWIILGILPFVGKLIGGFIGGTLTFAGFLILTCGVVSGLGAVWNTRAGTRLNDSR